MTTRSPTSWRQTETWHAREACRDLYDLWALADCGAIDEAAVAAFVAHGSTGRPPRPFMFARTPTENAWEAALAGQTRLEIGPGEAIAAVRNAWAAAIGESWD
ncbi:hypothetical protein [Hamadaea tsunoensis]|uniref:hypothetical protein n=1 Tax=Hamadaea tsunoensis TaxID=53368 RepID=UPI000413038B|nr:hypothetical protein [Hamadaea tsunoensis]